MMATGLDTPELSSEEVEAASEEEDVFIVEKIVTDMMIFQYIDRQICSFKETTLCPYELRFQVRWQGYGVEDDTFEPWDNVADSEPFQEYLDKHRLAVDSRLHQSSTLTELWKRLKSRPRLHDRVPRQAEHQVLNGYDLTPPSSSHRPLKRVMSTDKRPSADTPSSSTSKSPRETEVKRKKLFAKSKATEFVKQLKADRIKGKRSERIKIKEKDLAQSAFERRMRDFDGYFEKLVLKRKQKAKSVDECSSSKTATRKDVPTTANDNSQRASISAVSTSGPTKKDSLDSNGSKVDILDIVADEPSRTPTPKSAPKYSLNSNKAPKFNSNLESTADSGDEGETSVEVAMKPSAAYSGGQVG